MEGVWNRLTYCYTICGSEQTSLMRLLISSRLEKRYLISSFENSLTPRDGDGWFDPPNRGPTYWSGRSDVFSLKPVLFIGQQFYLLSTSDGPIYPAIIAVTVFSFRTYFLFLFFALSKSRLFSLKRRLLHLKVDFLRKNLLNVDFLKKITFDPSKQQAGKQASKQTENMNSEKIDFFN